MDDIYSNFAYDDAFRTMTVECDDLVLPLLNYVFGEHYDKSARIIRQSNEFFPGQQGGSQDKKITDSRLRVLFDGVEKDYHLECESSAGDASILIRMFEYGAQIALSEPYVTSGRLKVRFVNTGLLFLRSSKNTPNEMWIDIETPGGRCSYPVKVIKEADFTIGEIFARKLYFLLPFYLFNLEPQFTEMENNTSKLTETMEAYEDICRRLDHLTAIGELSVYSRSIIIMMIHKVSYKLTMKHTGVQKGIGEIMGGRVLDLEIIRARHEGLYEGWTEGRAEGKVEGEILNLIKQICRKLAKGKNAAAISEDLEEDIDRIEEICSVARDFAPDYDPEKIYEALQKAEPAMA